MGDIYWVTIYGRKKARKLSWFKKKRSPVEQDFPKDIEGKKDTDF